jgi:hypothetical protein
VSHFRTRADADAWLGSPQRARLVAEAGLHAAGELQTRYVSGLEGWLAAPGAPVLVPPARWKTALVAAPGSCRCRRRSATCSPRGWPRCRPMAGYRTGQPGKAGATAALRPHCGPLVRLTRGASPARSAHHLPTRASRPATPA